MKTREVDLPVSEIKTVCRIVSVFEEPLDYPEETGTATIVLTPLGMSNSFPVACRCYDKGMKNAEGKFVKTMLSVSWSSMKKADEFICSFTDSGGEEFTENSSAGGFKAVGQYLGDTGVDLLVWSKFIILASHDCEFEPKIGDWVEVVGELSVDWSSHDVIE